MDDLLRDYLAGVAAILLVMYSVSAGNDGHTLVQVPLLLAGGLVVYEGLVAIADDLRGRGWRWWRW